MPVSEDSPYEYTPPVHGGGSGYAPLVHPYSDATYTPEPITGLAYSQVATRADGQVWTGVKELDLVVNSVIDTLSTLTCGRVSINMASVTSLALTNVQSLYAVLSFYGSPGSAATVTVPAVPRLWVVRNGTDQTVTVKVSGQTGIAVLTTKTQMLYCNGFDVYAAAAAV